MPMLCQKLSVLDVEVPDPTALLGPSLHALVRCFCFLKVALALVHGHVPEILQIS